jgi:Tol biopolymer transport system component
MDADGTGQRRLTHSRGIDMHPAYSPNGQFVAFTSNRDGNYEIYVLDTATENVSRITHNPERDDFACWHPNGRQLVIVSEWSGKTDLYLVDVRDDVAR